MFMLWRPKGAIASRQSLFRIKTHERNKFFTVSFVFVVYRTSVWNRGWGDPWSRVGCPTPILPSGATAARR